jgi:hypothetical protein
MTWALRASSRTWPRSGLIGQQRDQAPVDHVNAFAHLRHAAVAFRFHGAAD